MHLDDFLNTVVRSKRSVVVDILTKILGNNSYAQMIARTCYIKDNPKLTRSKVLHTLNKDGYLYKITEFKDYIITINY